MLLLAVCAAVIALLTLLPQPIPPGSSPKGFCVLCGERGLADFLSNILMFVPFGVALHLCGLSLLQSALTALLFSAGIEALQIQLVTGRDSSYGDLLSNTIGGIAGWGAVHTRAWWNPPEEHSTRRCLAVTAIVIILLHTGLVLFTPHFPPARYFLQLAAEPGGTEVFQGSVFTARFSDVVLRGPPGPIEQTPRVRSVLLNQQMAAVFTNGPPTAGLAPIVAIYDENRDQVFLIGQKGTDLLLRYRMLSDEVLLDRVAITLPSVFAGVQPGDTMRLVLDATKRGYCADTGNTQRCTAGLSPGDTWGLLTAQSGRVLGRRGSAVVWLCLIMVVPGLLARRPRDLAASAGIVAVALVAIPPVLGFIPTPLEQVLAAAFGVSVGSIGAALLRWATEYRKTKRPSEEGRLS